MIFFDIDDTLFDNTGAETKAAEQFYRLYRNQLCFAGRDDFIDRWRRVTEKFLEMYIQGRLSFQEQRRHRLREIFAKPFGDAEADALFERYLAGYETSWKLFADVIPCLDRLAPLGLGVVSNGNSRQQRQKLERLGIIDRFRIIVISEDIATAKPDGRIFLHACHRAALPPSDCVYVGDKLDADALAAAAAGLRGIWLNRRREKRTCQAAVEIRGLDALRPETLG